MAVLGPTSGGEDIGTVDPGGVVVIRAAQGARARPAAAVLPALVAAAVAEATVGSVAASE
jgi:hypothetical protein